MNSNVFDDFFWNYGQYFAAFFVVDGEIYDITEMLQAK